MGIDSVGIHTLNVGNESEPLDPRTQSLSKGPDTETSSGKMLQASRKCALLSRSPLSVVAIARPSHYRRSAPITKLNSTAIPRESRVSGTRPIAAHPDQQEDHSPAISQ